MCFLWSNCITYKVSKSVQMYRMSKWTARWQACCLSCHSCQTFTDVRKRSVGETDVSPRDSVNNHTSKWKMFPGFQASREDFKLLLVETYWDFNLDMSDIVVNLHFLTLACVWKDSVRCPVHVLLVTSTRCDYQKLSPDIVKWFWWRGKIE